MKTKLTILAILVSFCLPLFAAEPTAGVGLTIYNDNFAVVRDTREMSFSGGLNTIRFTDVASAIDPTSVSFKSLTDPAAVTILEQNYDFDLLNTNALLDKYIDKDITLWVKGSGGSSPTYVSGILRSAMGNDLIIQTDEGLKVISRDAIQNIDLANLPEGFVTKPTLVWLTKSKEDTEQLCRVTYTTGNINWKADYTAILNDKDTALDLAGWVTIDNRSGAAYKEAALKLIAGDVRRVTEPVPARRGRVLYAAPMEMAADAFEEKEFMDYHMYTLPRKTTINNKQVKQIQLIEPAIDVPSEKIYVFDSSVSNWLTKSNKVQVRIEFQNTEENNLGIALPKGKVRVFKKDPADGSLEFVGEDTIDHTARKEKLSLYIGDAFDIVPEKKVMNAKHSDGYQRQDIEIELRNRKEEAVTVFVDEICPKGRNWKIADNSLDYEKKDAYTARFKVEIPADSKVTLKYTLTHTW